MIGKIATLFLSGGTLMIPVRGDTNRGGRELNDWLMIGKIANSFFYPAARYDSGSWGHEPVRKIAPV